MNEMYNADGVVSEEQLKIINKMMDEIANNGKVSFFTAYDLIMAQAKQIFKMCAGAVIVGVATAILSRRSENRLVKKVTKSVVDELDERAITITRF